MDPNIEARRKRNLDALYANIKAVAPDLYERVVAIASINFPAQEELPRAARLEGQLMQLVSDAMRKGRGL